MTEDTFRQRPKGQSPTWEGIHSVLPAQIFLDHFEQSHLGCISPAIVLAWLSIDMSKTCSEEMSMKVAGLLFLSSHPSEGAVTGQWQG